MIPHKNYVKPTAYERVRMDAMRKAGCIMAMVRKERGLEVPTRGRIDIHHLKDGGQVLGHWWTIALHSWWHRGVPPRGMSIEEARALYGAALTDGMKAFRECHGFDDRDLWVDAQGRMGMPVQFPPSKIVPRRLPTPSLGNGERLGRASPETTRDPLPEASRSELTASSPENT